MIVLDTDVLSGLMRPQPDAALVNWFDRQARVSIWTTAVTVLEVRFGTALLAPGSRRTRLEQAFARVLAEMIEDRIAPFDTASAETTATLMAERRKSGRPIELRDAMIAGIAIARHSTLATRNTRHFADLTVAVVDPWTA